MGSTKKLSKPRPTSTPSSSFGSCLPFGCGRKGKKKSKNAKERDLSPTSTKPAPPNTRAITHNEGTNELIARAPSGLTRSAKPSTSVNRTLSPSESSANLRLGSALTTITERTEPESEPELERPTVPRVLTINSLPVIDEDSIIILPQARRHSAIPDFRQLEDYEQDSPRPADKRRYSLPTVPTYHLPLRAQPSFASSFEGFDAFFTPDHKRLIESSSSSSKSEESKESEESEESEEELKDYNKDENEGMNYRHHPYNSDLDPSASMKGPSRALTEGARPSLVTITRRGVGYNVDDPSRTALLTTASSSTAAPFIAAPSLSLPSASTTALSTGSTLVKALANLPDQGNSIRTSATATRIALNGTDLDLNKPLPMPPPQRTWRRRLTSMLHQQQSGTTLNRGSSQSFLGSQSLLGVARSAARSVESFKESIVSDGSAKAPSTWKSLNWTRAPAVSVVPDSPPILPVLDSTEFSDLLRATAAITSSRPVTPAGAEVQNERLATPQMVGKSPITPNSNRLVRSPACKDLRVISGSPSVVSFVLKGPTKRTLSWVSTVHPGGDHIEDGKSTPESKLRTTPSSSTGDGIPDVCGNETEPQSPIQQIEEGEKSVNNTPPSSPRRDGFRRNYKEFMDESLERYGRSGSGGKMERELSITDSVSLIVGDRTSRIDPRKERMLEIWGDVKAGESTIIV